MKHIVAFLLIINATARLIAQDSCVNVTYGFEGLRYNKSYQTYPDTIGPINQKEISGIVQSIRYPDHFWAINDSGNGAVLYLYSVNNASLKAIFVLKGILNIDWEDLSIQNSDDGREIIYIPDFGDNQAKRKGYTIYKIPEPDLPESSKKIHNLLVDPEKIVFNYENGARDAESLAFDPIDKKPYVITKREKNVFIYPIETKTSSLQTLVPIGTLPLTNVVAANFSSDGMRFILKTYTHVYLWTRSGQNESFCDLLSKPPEEVPYQLEPQGEAICFIDDSFITVSEERFGIRPVLYRYDFIKSD